MSDPVGKRLVFCRNGKAVPAVVRACPENVPKPPTTCEGRWVLIATAHDQFAAVFDGADFYVGDVKLRVVPELFELRPRLSAGGRIEFEQTAPDTSDPRVAELMRYLGRL